MKLSLTYVGHFDKDKSGKPYTNAKGPYEKCLIKAAEYGDRWISLFGGKTTKTWKVGDTIDIEVEEKDGYLNGRVPNQAFELGKKVAELELEINKVKKQLADHIAEEKKSAAAPESGAPEFPQDEINLDDIPF